MMKFFIMLLTVVAVGTGATLLNLNLREQSGPEGMMLEQNGFGEEGIREVVPNAYSWQPEQNTNRAWDDSPETGADTADVKLTSADNSAEEALQEDADKIAPKETDLVMEGSLSENTDGVAQEEMLAIVESETEAETTGAVAEYKMEVIIASEESKDTYYYRLQDMDKKLMDIMNAAMKESLTKQQSAVETALEFWDDELNAIYQKLRNTLPEDEFSALRTEERAWIRSRDEAANVAASKENHSNSTQNLAYTRSLLEWTKERVYVLAKMYYGE